ncbi:MAG: toxic anion resistance protein, partial [Dehalococcoidia bacterium]|nr:toxic anion resistance protein [Dehalococcoidia bacterium]
MSPESVTHRSMVSRAMGSVPFVSNRYNPIVRALGKVALRYEPVSKQVSVIETRLLDGRALLVRDNIELRKLYEDLEEHQLDLQKNAYLGELLIRDLTALMERTDDVFRRDRLEGALHDVAIRVQDLKTVEQV